MNEIKTTRWQLRVEKDLEKKIRDLSNKEKRSINKMIIFILEKYFQELDQIPPLEVHERTTSNRKK